MFESLFFCKFFCDSISLIISGISEISKLLARVLRNEISIGLFSCLKYSLFTIFLGVLIKNALLLKIKAYSINIPDQSEIKKSYF